MHNALEAFKIIFILLWRVLTKSKTEHNREVNFA